MVRKLFRFFPDMPEQEFDRRSFTVVGRRITDLEHARHADLVATLLHGFGMLGTMIRVSLVFQSVMAIAGAEPDGRIAGADQAEHIDVGTQLRAAWAADLFERGKTIKGR